MLTLISNHQKQISILLFMVYCNNVVFLFLKALQGGSMGKTRVFKPPRNQKLNCAQFIQYLKISSFISISNRQKQIRVLRDVLHRNKVLFFSFKVFWARLWLKLKFPNLPEIRIWTFLSLFSISKCSLSPRVRNRQKQISVVPEMVDYKKAFFFFFFMEVFQGGSKAKTQVPNPS